LPVRIPRRCAVPQTIDVTGLSPEAVRAVQALVETFRKQAAQPAVPPAAPASTYWPGPPPGETAEEWIARLRAWAESHPKRDIEIDDDRGSIYDRSCE
jgi:hypothetical protein